jgi:hypothetical protein
MNAKDIKPGAEYGFRERPAAGLLLERVKVIERVRGGKWKVEWLDPNPGLTDYVKSASIVVPWAKRRALLRDEDSDARLVACSREQWPGRDSPLEDAVSAVLEATGEEMFAVYGRSGVWNAPPECMERIAARAGIALPESAYAYTDRNGLRHQPFEVALRVAQAFAASEPRTVLTNVELQERQYEIEAKEPGGAHLLPLLQRWRVGWAIVRQWAGLDRALAERDEEIERLRRIVWDAIHVFRREHHDSEADRLERALKGR